MPDYSQGSPERHKTVKPNAERIQSVSSGIIIPYLQDHAVFYFLKYGPPLSLCIFSGPHFSSEDEDVLLDVISGAFRKFKKNIEEKGFKNIHLKFQNTGNATEILIEAEKVGVFDKHR